MIIIYCIIPILYHLKDICSPCVTERQRKGPFLVLFSLEFDSYGHVFFHRIESGSRHPPHKKRIFFFFVPPPSPLPPPPVTPNWEKKVRKIPPPVLPQKRVKQMQDHSSFKLLVCWKVRVLKKKEKHIDQESTKYLGSTNKENIFFWGGNLRFRENFPSPTRSKIRGREKMWNRGARNIPHPRTFFIVGESCNNGFPFPSPPSLLCCLDKMNCG